ncbi:MAG: hypothetical protein HFJ40_08260 [Clostridia bacterium]|nr:hypothetical protein [Clostridia bacterium]
MVEKYRYMRKGNSNRIRRKDNFRENAEKVVKDICNLNKHFMNKYWVDLLIIVHKDCHLNEIGLQEEMTKKLDTSKLATLEFIRYAAEDSKNWLRHNGTDYEIARLKDIVKKQNSASNILKLLVEHIENL